MEILLVLIRLPLEFSGRRVVQMDEAAVPYLRPSFDACFSLCCVCRYELDGQGEMLSANLEIVPVSCSMVLQPIPAIVFLSSDCASLWNRWWGWRVRVWRGRGRERSVCGLGMCMEQLYG